MVRNSIGELDLESRWLRVAGALVLLGVAEVAGANDGAYMLVFLAFFGKVEHIHRLDVSVPTILTVDNVNPALPIIRNIP